MDSQNKNINDRQNVSFKFSKTSSKALIGNRLDESSKDYVTSVDKNEIKSTQPKLKAKELVIPLIKKNNWRIKDGPSDKESEIKNLAIKELLKETSEKNFLWENRVPDPIIHIPLIMQNKVPLGFETDEKMDVSLRPEESKLDDYERVPVDQYGLAILRGMGWKDGDAIGNNHTESAAPIQVQLRPKGLGLGADASALNKSQKKAKEEKLELVNQAYVHIIQGPHKGFYGQVLGLDEENARAIVKLSDDEKAITFPEFFIEVVSKKEFDKESKIINRASYENYKRDREEKEKHEKHSIKKDKADENFGDKKNKREADKEGSAKKSKRRYPSRDRSEEAQHSSSTLAKLWVKPQLKVRFIDDQYKNGKYFNKKLVVVDVLSSKSCSCRTDDNKYLDDVSPSMLETVIPRDEASYVMIVQGKYSGELCTILKKDKSKCVATVQFLSDRNQALKIEYDSICEFVGDVSQFD